jgi:hypothetical protein
MDLFWIGIVADRESHSIIGWLNCRDAQFRR